LKVAINTLFLIPGEVGGSETYLRETLSAIVQEHPDIELALITNRENDAWARELFGPFPQCSFQRAPIHATNRYARIAFEQTGLPLFLKRIRPHLLWSPGYTMPWSAPCAQVVSILDMQYRTHPEDMGKLARGVTHALIHMAARRADKIITISHFAKDEIKRATGCPAEQIEVTHLGVDPAFGTPVDPSGGLQHRLIQDSSPYLLCVANSYPHKNLHRLAEAFARLTDCIPHRLVLVGRPRRGEALLAKALAVLPANRVARIQGLSRAELIALYQQADLFVFPSLYEGFGLPVLEAMMAGTPVVTTRCASLPEIGGTHVTYANGCDPADLAAQMAGVLAWSPAQRHARTCAAQRHASLFIWSRTADATVGVWRRCI